MDDKHGTEPYIQEEGTKEGYIQVTGGRIWYRAIEKNKKGLPLLVIHGGPGASYDYLEPLEKLAEERPVIFYDQLGCGNSDRPNDPALWTIERYVQELHQVRTALGLEKVHILGQSWGSSLAVDYALTSASKNVVSLVLSGPLLSTQRWIKDQDAWIEKLPDNTRKIIHTSEQAGKYDSEQYQDAMMAYYRIHVCRLDPWPECLNRCFEKLNPVIYSSMWGPSEFTVTGTLKGYERAEQLSKITIPVLFTCGQYDEAAPSTVKYYHKNLQGSKLHIFEDASHEHHLEKPQEYVQVVQDFLKHQEH